MHIPAAASLLALWEEGRGASPLDRALLLLAASFPTLTAADLAQWPVGVRDGCLLHLRRALFGSHLEGTAACPACGVMLEFALSVDDLLPVDWQPPAPHATLDNLARDLLSGGYEVQFRLPTSHDLLAVEALSREDAATALPASCLLSAHKDGQPVTLAELPAAILNEMAAAMANADALAEIELTFTCANCGHRWQAFLDIGAYLWRELDQWVALLLQEIHLLALAYGWNETEILALSPWRRRYYMSLVYG
jgi:hypothetical protein